MFKRAANSHLALVLMKESLGEERAHQTEGKGMALTSPKADFSRTIRTEHELVDFIHAYLQDMKIALKIAACMDLDVTKHVWNITKGYCKPEFVDSKYTQKIKGEDECGKEQEDSEETVVLIVPNCLGTSNLGGADF